MRFSLLTRIIFAFCLVAFAASALLWAHIAMQNRIMARYDATQSTDIASLRDLKQARRSVIDYRNDLLQENPDDLARSLRLSARFAPAQKQLERYLHNIGEREPAQESFKEREKHQDALRAQRQRTLALLQEIPDQNRALLQEIDRDTPNESKVQQQLGALLVTLDDIESHVLDLHQTISARYEESTQRIGRDQQRAAQMTTLLALLAFIAFAVAVGTIWRALSPIQRLTSAATKVGEGDFNIERIRAGNDEIGQLTEAFYAMTQALLSRDRALSAANQQREDAYQQLIHEEKARIQAERLAVVGALSARITHELRNPLSSLSLNVEMILEDPQLGELEEDTRDMLRSMKQEIERLESLSSGYLSLARKPVGAHLPINFTRLVEDTLAQFRRSTELDQVRVESDLCPDVWTTGDENELRGVLINLIENARVAVSAQEHDRRIRVTLRQSDDMITWTIDDNGPGVDADIVDELFDPFVTNRPEGTGLGLSTSRRIAEAHGGTLTYAPSSEGGACFSLRLHALEQGADAPTR